MQEGELGDVAEAKRHHLQDDRRKVGAQNLGLHELRPRVEVLFGVEPNRNTVTRSTGTPGALIGAGLADRFDRQSLNLCARAVTTDARRSRIDDIADAGHSQTGFGDVGGQHDPASRAGSAS